MLEYFRYFHSCLIFVSLYFFANIYFSLCLKMVIFFYFCSCQWLLFAVLNHGSIESSSISILFLFSNNSVSMYFPSSAQIIHLIIHSIYLSTIIFNSFHHNFVIFINKVRHCVEFILVQFCCRFSLLMMFAYVFSWVLMFDYVLLG